MKKENTKQEQNPYFFNSEKNKNPKKAQIIGKTYDYNEKQAIISRIKK